MNNIKKFTSLIISVLLVFTSLVVPEFSAKANTTDTNDKEVYNSSLSSGTKANFSQNGATLTNDEVQGTHVTDANDAVLKLTGDGSDAAASKSKQWIFGGTVTNMQPEDWSSYNYLNFRIRNTSTDAGGNPIDGSFIFKMFPSTGGNWTKTDGHTVTGNEWQTLSVEIPNGFTPSNGVVDKTSMNNIAGLQFTNIAGTMWLERIWLSTEKPGSTKDIFDSSSASSTKDYFNREPNATLSSGEVDSNDRSLILTGTGTNSDESRNPTFTAQDWTDFNYINFKIKNSNSVDSTFYFYATVNKANANGANGYWMSKKITVSGSAWQTVSVAIPGDFGFQSNASTPTIYTEMSHIEGLRFDYIKGTMHLEKIWLSTEKPNDNSGDNTGGDNTGGDNTGGDNTGDDDNTTLPGELFSSSSTSSTNSIFSNAYAALTNEAVESNDKSLKLTGTGTNDNESKNPVFAAQDWTGYNYINFRVKNSSATENGMFLFYATVTGSSATGAAGYWSSKTIKVEGTAWQTVSVAIPNNFTFQHTAATPTVYDVMSHIEGLRFDYIKGTMYLEKIWLSETKPEETYLTASSVPNGYDDVSVDAASFAFTYSQDLAPTGKQNAKISFTAGGGDVAFDASYSENKLIIVPKNTLEYNTPYSISISGVKDHNGFGIPKETVLKFTTVEKGVIASNLTILSGDDSQLADMPSSGRIKASVQIDNKLADSAGATLVLACYDSNGKMILQETDIKSVSLAPSETKPIAAQITSSDYSGKTVCAFVIDSITSRNLLTPDFASLPVRSSGEAGSVLAGGANELTFGSFDFANDIANLKASLNGGMERTLLMSILSGDSVIHMSPLCSSSDGNVSVDYKMTNSDASGNYAIELKGRKIKNTLTQDFYHLSQLDKETVFNKANSLSSVADGVALLNTYGEVFQLDASSVDNSTLMHMIAEALLYNKPFADFEAVKSFVKEAVRVCGNLNSQTWDTLGSYVINNENILIGNYDISDFKALSETNRNKVCNTINPLTFTSLKDLYSKITNATKAYNDSLISKPTPSRPSGGSGGGNYSVSTPSVVVPQPPVSVPEFSFTDLADYSWAEDSIQNLLDKGIISKSPDNKYRPADMITRSEFVKLIVCALYDANESASSEFADVNSDDWCYAYISIATKYGLVNGREDGKFGKNDYITRQEMAAVIYRAILNKNIDLPSGLSEYAYADDAAISDYAKDAVYALYHAGIMSGMGDGNFASYENANRAQAACVIDRILKGANK